MAQLDLTAEEIAVLLQVLQDFRSELRMEIADTDSSFYREGLKHEREVLDAVLAKLSALQQSS